MSYDDTRFEVMFTRYGGWPRVLHSYDFYSSLIGAAVGTALVLLDHLAIAFVLNSGVAFVTVSAAMIATSLAGLAIISSISDPEFVKFAKSTRLGESTVYDNIIFAFWYSALVSFASLLADVISVIVVSTSGWFVAARVAVPLMVFLLLYSITAVMLLLGTVSRWGFYRGIFVEADLHRKPGD